MTDELFHYAWLWVTDAAPAPNRTFYTRYMLYARAIHGTARDAHRLAKRVTEWLARARHDRGGTKRTRQNPPP